MKKIKELVEMLKSYDEISGRLPSPRRLSVAAEKGTDRMNRMFRVSDLVQDLKRSPVRNKPSTKAKIRHAATIIARMNPMLLGKSRRAARSRFLADRKTGKI